jgi:hypothetical protein
MTRATVSGLRHASSKTGGIGGSVEDEMLLLVAKQMLNAIQKAASMTRQDSQY